MSATTGTNATLEFGEELSFTIRDRGSVGGKWVLGLLAGHRFHALVFAEHAHCDDHELGESRIAKLWVQRIADNAVVYNFDRGLDVPPQDATAREIVDFLIAGLAEHVASV